MNDNFDPNTKDGRHVVAAILTAGFAPVLLKKEPKNLEIKHVVDLYWDFASLLRKGSPKK
jgi:hypothetical protein